MFTEDPTSPAKIGEPPPASRAFRSVVGWWRRNPAAHPPLRTLTGVLGLGFVAILWGLTLRGLQADRETAIADTIRRNDNFALALAEHTSRSIKAVDETLRFVVDQHREHGGRVDVGRIAGTAMLNDDMVLDLGIIDEHGKLTSAKAQPPETFSDRGYFRLHKVHPDVGLHISEPSLGHTKGYWTFTVSRRISRADGSFAGVVFAAVDPRYFLSFYYQADLGTQGLIALTGTDVVLRARRSGDYLSFGGDMKSTTLMRAREEKSVGHFVSLGLRDVPRYNSYYTLRQYPLVVEVGTSVRESLAGFSRHARAEMLSASVTSAVVALFCGGLILVLGLQRKAIAKLAESEASYRAIFDNAASSIVVTDAQGRIVQVNERTYAGLGYSRDELLGQPFHKIAHPDAVPQMREDRRLLESGERETVEREMKFLKRDGSAGWAHRTLSLVRSPSGEPRRFVSMFRDITARRAAEEQVRLAALAMENTVDGIMITDAKQRIVSVNKAFSRVTGYSVEEAMGQTPALLHSGRQDAGFYRDMWREIGRTGSWRGEIWNRRRDGESYPQMLSVSAVSEPAGQVTHYVGVFNDISRIKEYEERLAHLAHHDPLTGLPNRVTLRDRLAVALEHEQRRNGRFAVAFVDLDRFKLINDSLGHGIGDRLLKVAAQRLGAAVRGGDTVSRQGGDEFVLLLDDIRIPEDAGRVAEKIIETLSQPYQIDGHELAISASVGLALYPENGEDIDALLRNADAAMYAAKAAGRARYQFYSSEMNQRASERLALEVELRHAVARDELFVIYQPQVDIGSGRVVGAEALLRWRHPKLGLVSPARFIPVAEESGQILGIGDWMMHRVCVQAQRWQREGLLAAPMSINVSSIQFRQADFVGRVLRTLDDTGLAPESLELEVTESVMMHGTDSMIAKLRELQTAGVKLAIDDFGTGYSSLSYLTKFPIGRLKIDQSFVRELPDSQNAAAVALAIIGMGHSLQMRVVAEGVETVEQAGFLSGIGCEDAQGFLYAKPMLPEQLEQWLQERELRGNEAQARRAA